MTIEVFHTKSCREATAELALEPGWCIGAGCYLIATGLPVPKPEGRRPFKVPDLRR